MSFDPMGIARRRHIRHSVRRHAIALLCWVARVFQIICAAVVRKRGICYSITNVMSQTAYKALLKNI